MGVALLRQLLHVRNDRRQTVVKYFNSTSLLIRHTAHGYKIAALRRRLHGHGKFPRTFGSIILNRRCEVNKLDGRNSKIACFKRRNQPGETLGHLYPFLVVHIRFRTGNVRPGNVRQFWRANSAGIAFSADNERKPNRRALGQ